jgi:hypothetical protein
MTLRALPLLSTLTLAFLATSCSSTKDAGGLAPPPPDQGFQFSLKVTAPPRAETWKCKVDNLPELEGGGRFDFNRAISKQTVGMHHMSLAVLTSITVEPGIYDCKELYAKYAGMMEEPILYASAFEDQTLTLPKGIVAPVPAFLRTLHEIHYVNQSDQPVELTAQINAYRLPLEEVTGQIWGGSVRDKDIVLPPKSKTDEWNRCVVSKDVDVLLLSTHTHQRSRRTEIFTWNGKERGESVYESTDWHSPVPLDLTASPRHVKAGEGFEFHCHYQNPTSETIKLGLSAEDEMCNMILVFTPGDTSVECKIQESGTGLE